MLKKLVILFFTAGILGSVVFISGYYSGKNKLISKTHSMIVNWSFEEPYNLSQLSDFELKENQDFHEFLDNIRYFVHDNSVRHTGQNGIYGAAQNNRALVISQLLSTKYENTPPPELLCSSRVGAMQQILTDFGYESRMTHIFAQNPGNHTFLEVRNPRTNEWEIQDPDYNLVYKDKRNGKHIGVNELILKSLQNIIPCKGDGDCSWDYAGVLYDDDYYGAAMIFDWNTKPPVMLINSNRFDVNLPLGFDSEKRPILDYVQEMWGKDYNGFIDIVVPGSPY